MDISIPDLFRKLYYNIIKARNYPRWRGVGLLKMPEDIAVYTRVIQEKQPDFIVETGTRFGGSALFFADMLELNKKGHVISIDVSDKHQPLHDRVTYLTGSSIDDDIVTKIKEMVGNKTVMVVLDSKHTSQHVRWELHKYSNIVTPGQYIVVEDCYNKFFDISGPMVARDLFLQKTNRFKVVPLVERYFVGLSLGGWLLKR